MSLAVVISLSATLLGQVPALATPGTDGRSLMIDGERVRLWGIQSPPDYARCSGSGGCVEAARLHLRRQLASGPLICRIKVHERQGPASICEVDGRDLAIGLVSDGLMLDEPRESRRHYERYENVARGRSSGMWR